MALLPGTVDTAASRGRVTLNVATNADSLGTWFLDAVAAFSRETGFLLNIAIDDEDHTADWLRRGRVLAAVTSLEKPVQGCQIRALGALRYRAVASPEFVAHHFAAGVTPMPSPRRPASPSPEGPAAAGLDRRRSALAWTIRRTGCPRRQLRRREPPEGDGR